MQYALTPPQIQIQLTKEGAQLHVEHAQKLWSAMAHVMQDRAVKQEALMLLINSLATISTQPDIAARRVAFSSWLQHGQYIDSGSAGHEYAAELLRLLCEIRPAEVAKHIDRYCPQAVDMYFRGEDQPGSGRVDEQRIDSFFCGHGAAAGTHGNGPIASYCLDHRGDVWHMLVWNSHHAHSPVAVLTRPQYWDDLDVVRTVANLLVDDPGFLTSRHLWKLLQQGALIKANPRFFADHLLATLDQQSEDGASSLSDKASPPYRNQDAMSSPQQRHRATQSLMASVNALVEEYPYALLCRRLLHLLLPEDVVRAARALVGHDAPHDSKEAKQKRDHSNDASSQHSCNHKRRREQADAMYTAAAGRPDRDSAKQSPATELLSAKQLALRSLVSTTSSQRLDSLLIAHSAVMCGNLMLRWLSEDEHVAGELEIATQQLRERMPAVWTLLQHQALAMKTLLRVVNCLTLFDWLSAAQDTCRLETALHIAGIQYHRQRASDHLLLEEPQAEQHHKHKRKRKHKHKHKRRSPEPSAAEIDSEPRTDVSEQLRPEEAIWFIVEESGSQKQMLSREMQQLLSQMAFSRWDVKNC